MRRILLVDDDPDILESYRRLLESEFPGTRIVTAPGPREALAALEGQAVDLIISDYRMPNMDGLEFLARAHVLRPEARRVLLSAYVEAARGQGVAGSPVPDAFISKAESVEILLGSIKSALEQAGS